MQLTDIYCMYNRARGTTLISPDELAESCMLFKKLSLPLCLRTLESGVMVLQLKKMELAMRLSIKTLVNNTNDVSCVCRNRKRSTWWLDHSYKGIQQTKFAACTSLCGHPENAGKLGMPCQTYIGKLRLLSSIRPISE